MVFSRRSRRPRQRRIDIEHDRISRFSPGAMVCSVKQKQLIFWK